MARINRRRATVPIYQGDDLERIADLRRSVDIADRNAQRAAKARQGGTARMDDDDDAESVESAKAAYDAFVRDAAERAVIVELRALDRVSYRDLVADHPPRTKVDDEGKTVPEPDDDALGLDVETFPAALLGFADGEDAESRTIYAPEFATSKERKAFIDKELSEGDFDTLWGTAYALNTAQGADPKASLYSAAPRSSTET